MAVNEQVHVVNINNGQRFVTYVLEGEEGSGIVCVNGACARLCEEGDRVIIVTYCMMEAEERQAYQPKIVHVRDSNLDFAHL